jgi:uncharacterized protein
LTRLQQVTEFVFGKLEKELPRHLTYHNVYHTKDVMQAAEFLADTENIEIREKELLLTAAALHDCGFVVRRDEHEAESCNIAINCLPLFGYDVAEAVIVCDLIKATRVPQAPASKLAEILCDADLDYLGRDDFFTLSDRLFVELRSERLVNDLDEWNREQADFMGSHSYFTQTAVNLRQPKKEQHTELIRSKISTQIFNENR